MTFKYVSGRRSLDFAGTLKYRTSAREELLTDSQQLSNWAVEAGLVDAAIEIGDDELAAAISLREAIYRVVVARLKGHQLPVADARHAASTAEFGVIATQEVVFAIELPPRKIQVHATNAVVIVRGHFFQLREISASVAADGIHQVFANHA